MWKLPRIVEVWFKLKETLMAIVIRILIFAALAWFGYRLVRQYLDKKALPPTQGNDTSAPQPMLACAYCSVHIPVGESTQSRGKVFCCEAHRDNYFRENPPSE